MGRIGVIKTFNQMEILDIKSDCKCDYSLKVLLYYKKKKGKNERRGLQFQNKFTEKEGRGGTTGPTYVNERKLEVFFSVMGRIVNIDVRAHLKKVQLGIGK